MIDRKQLIRRIHGVGSSLGMNHEEIHMAADVDSLDELNTGELRNLYDDLCLRQQQVNGLSESQKSNIYRLGYRELNWAGSDIIKFIKKQIGYEKRVEILTAKEATKVINGMEAIIKYRRVKH